MSRLHPECPRARAPHHSLVADVLLREEPDEEEDDEEDEGNRNDDEDDEDDEDEDGYSE